MGKKGIGFNTLSNVALLEPCTATQYVRHAVVQLAQGEFADLDDPSLKTATERWEVSSAFDSLYGAYSASVGKDCQVVTRRIEKFRRKHNI